MPSVRKLKTRFFSRIWFAAPNRYGYNRRKGLAFHDPRSHQRSRWPRGANHRALNFVPFDDLHVEMRAQKLCRPAPQFRNTRLVKGEQQ